MNGWNSLRDQVDTAGSYAHGGACAADCTEAGPCSPHERQRYAAPAYRSAHAGYKADPLANLPGRSKTQHSDSDAGDIDAAFQTPCCRRGVPDTFRHRHRPAGPRPCPSCAEAGGRAGTRSAATRRRSAHAAGGGLSQRHVVRPISCRPETAGGRRRRVGARARRRRALPRLRSKHRQPRPRPARIRPGVHRIRAKQGVRWRGKTCAGESPDSCGSVVPRRQGIWRRGEPWLQEVRAPQTFPWEQADLTIKLSRAKFAQLGVTYPDGRPLPNDDMPASLLLPMGRTGPAFLAYANFAAYTEWNNSLIY